MAELANIAQVDELVREWLLFRGFTATWNSYSAELASDCSCEFQVRNPSIRSSTLLYHIVARPLKT